MRNAADILDEVGRHALDPVGAQGQRVGETTEPRRNRVDDLVVAADRGEEMRDIVRHFLRHLAPFALTHHRVEFQPEILEPMHRQHRVIGRGRAIKRDALAHPFEALGDRRIVRPGGEETTAGDLVLGAGASRFR